jgi:lipopolysaccharide export system permease protein
MHARTGKKRITLFVEDIDKENVVMKRFFMHVEEKSVNKKNKDTNGNIKVEEKIENILAAQKALLYIDPESGGRIFKIENGSRYDNNRNTGEFSIFKFAEHGIHIPALKIKSSSNLEADSFLKLLKNKDKESKAEIHWRLALILQAPVMALLAFPLSYTTPRQGRFGKLALGILLYAVYANLIITGKSMIEDGRIPNWMGLWWAHLIFIILALWLVRRQYGRVQ